MKNHHKELFGFAGSVGRTERAAPLIVLALLLGSGERAAGYPVTFEFAGEVESFTDARGLLGGAVELGTPFSGSLTFESTTPDSLPDEPSVGFYAETILSVTGEVGGVPFGTASPTGSWIQVVNDSIAPSPPGFDFYDAKATVGFVGSPVGFILSVADENRSILSSDALPLMPPSLEMWTASGFAVGDQEIGTSVFGPLTVFVPEPSTLTLLPLGAITLLWRRRNGLKTQQGRGKRTAVATLVSVVGAFAMGTAVPSAHGQTVNCGCMDVVFLLDITNSMEPALSSMQADLRSVINDVAIPASGGDLRLGLITFNDPGVMAPPDSIRVWSPLTMDINAVLEQVDALVVDQGNHPRPEISDEALREMLLAAWIGSGTTCAAVSETRFDVPFRSHCVKHVILITDDLPGGCDNVFDVSDVTNAVARAVEAARAGIIISAIYVPTSTSPGSCFEDPTMDVCTIMMHYTDATGGVWTQTGQIGQGIAAALTPHVGTCPDCQPNGINDLCDISCSASPECTSPCGGSIDCNNNAVPDECESADDCNGNGILDVCDLVSGVSCDEDLNFVPDECFACCDESSCANTLPESCAGTSYPGAVCQECTCQQTACCAQSSCSQIVDCQCVSNGGHVMLGTQSCGAPPFVPDPCTTGTCCAPAACNDDVFGQPMTEEDCSHTFIGGADCSGVPNVCTDLPTAECCTDPECDDGEECNGLERCNAGFCAAGSITDCNENQIDDMCEVDVTEFDCNANWTLDVCEGGPFPPDCSRT